MEGSSAPDSIVAIDGCYYAYQQLSFDFPVELLDNKTVPIFLVSGLGLVRAERGWEDREASEQARLIIGEQANGPVHDGADGAVPGRGGASPAGE